MPTFLPQHFKEIMKTTQDRIYARAVEVFEDEEKAKRWLLKPCRAIGGIIPRDLLGTPAGIRTVEDELERIERSVYY